MSSEFSNSTKIGGILIPFSPTKSLLWRTFLFSPSGPATTIHNSSQYLALIPSEFSDSTGIFPLQNHSYGGCFYFLLVDLLLQSQFQSVSGSDAADLKNNLTQTRSSEFSNSTEIGGILINSNNYDPLFLISLLIVIDHEMLKVWRNVGYFFQHAG